MDPQLVAEILRPVSLAMLGLGVAFGVLLDSLVLRPVVGAWARAMRRRDDE